MPELAEVEYFRKQWDSGIGKKVTRVHSHADKRPFRGIDVSLLEQIAGKKLVESRSAGKQMLFRFSGGLWLGLHLGMTGKLGVEAADYPPAKHDHLVLFQSGRALVFNDMRQFGRVLLHKGKEAPEWWTSISPGPLSPEFNLEHVSQFLARHPKLPLKSTLLLQKGFPGVGNWMADEILWRAKLNPHRKAGAIKPREISALLAETRYVCEVAMTTIGNKFEDAPEGWLFHQRWNRKGKCPKHKSPLQFDTIGGRTTAWCEKCQK